VRRLLGNDDAFDALADRRRRQLLVDLLHHEPRPVPTLSDASRELLGANESLLGEFLAGNREIDDADKTAVRMYHVHLPKLVEYGYVEWDRDADAVSKGMEFDAIRHLLEMIDERRSDPIMNDAAARGPPVTPRRRR